MTLVYLLQAAPRIVASGTTTAVRLAGGGSRPYAGYLGFPDWFSGLVGLPRFTTEVGFDATGWNGGAVPQSAQVRFATNDIVRAAALAAYYWKGARVTLSSGDDTFGPPTTWKTEMVGTVASEPTLAGGVLTLVISDLSGDLAKPIVPNTFAGTGGIEGPTEATGRVKRRSWGRVFNVEGRILDKVNSIYEFGDPAQPLLQFDALKDKGRTGPMTVLAWQGSIAATLAALQAATAPEGGGVVAPSIACAKWWTTPSGPLTADLRGEVGTSYVETAIGIAARVVAAVSSLSTGFTINATRSYAVGVHCDSATETAQNVLDRVLLGCGLIWTLDPSGIITIGQFTWSAPVETLTSHTVERDAGFIPLKARRVGYQVNYRIHSDAEISAAVIDNPNAGPNLIQFSQFEGGTAGWSVSDPSGITSPLVPSPTGGKVAGSVPFTATAAGQVFTLGQDAAYAFPVTPTTNLVSMLGVTATGPIATLEAIVTWYDATGAAFSPVTFATLNGAQAFALMRLHVPVPAGAVTATLSLKVTTSGAGAGAAQIIEPLATLMPQGASNFPAFVPGPNAGDGATRNDDAANMIPAPGDATTWQFFSGAVLDTSLARPRGKLSAATANVRFSGFVPCQGSQTLFFRYMLAADASNADTVNASYVWRDVAGNTAAVNLSAISSRTMADANVAGGIPVESSFVTPAGCVAIQFYVERPTYSGGNLYAEKPWLAKTQYNADVTLASQITATLSANIVQLIADYQGNLASGQTASFFPIVKRNGVTFNTDNGMSYTLTSMIGGTWSVDNTNGSSTKSIVQFDPTTMTGNSATARFTAAYNGTTIFVIDLQVTKKLGDPPSGGGGGGGGGGGTSSVSIPADRSSANTTDVSVSSSSNPTLTVASGQKLYASYAGSYVLSGFVSAVRWGIFTHQYSTDNSNWSAFGAAVTGDPASISNSGGHNQSLQFDDPGDIESYPGSVTINQSVSVSPAVYYCRTIFHCNTTGRIIVLQGEYVTYEAKP